ncbi:MarR family transcriptional regulator [Acidianus brierleyi]|nr:MarR family transcriptional regulator [Acidianus brierleyi]AWR94105.2 MarR family transcriptional regulator [Acidianus brierleyi]
MNTRDSILVLLYERGELSKEELANMLRQEVDEIEALLKGLEREGLVMQKEKGLIFKRKVYGLTPSGLEEAKKAKEDLENKANKLIQAIQNGDYSQIQSFESDIPLMLALSMIDMMMLQGLMFDMFQF